jgi:hypothetical protein
MSLLAMDKRTVVAMLKCQVAIQMTPQAVFWLWPNKLFLVLVEV